MLPTSGVPPITIRLSSPANPLESSGQQKFKHRSAIPPGSVAMTQSSGSDHHSAQAAIIPFRARCRTRYQSYAVLASTQCCQRVLNAGSVDETWVPRTKFCTRSPDVKATRRICLAQTYDALFHAINGESFIPNAIARGIVFIEGSRVHS